MMAVSGSRADTCGIDTSPDPKRLRRATGGSARRGLAAFEGDSTGGTDVAPRTSVLVEDPGHDDMPQSLQ
jgi:hypothetical protein